MLNSNIANIVVLVLYSFIHLSYNIDHFDIESMAVSCPERDKCSGYSFNKNFTERNCECDSACFVYNDCCVDHRRKSESVCVPEDAHRMVCLNIGENNHTGVYAVTTCSENWMGPPEVREKCEGPDDFSNPSLAAPVTITIERAVPLSLTFRNHYCAECNDADMDRLKVFQISLSCQGLEDVSNEEILSDLSYNKLYKAWGVSRLTKENEARFFSCTMFFDVPSYIRKYIRFCRSNLVSSCNRFWRGYSVKERCAEYMAVVYDGSLAYRNPHCAFCNYKLVDDISCQSDLFSRKRPIRHILLKDINEKYWLRNKSTDCPYNFIYVPFLGKCKRISSIQPGKKSIFRPCIERKPL